ncbi:MAG: TetR/AcrR family transcriptional regulator [Paenibacillus sp.]|uniref:TetR/AcrR family transcriptional regulator n=1 Tax=Paenibacillus sp. TaxID=58172 RepID=UPI0025E7CA1D|nr:TetR/AcrR family transcriptional regulator [Paenibacillus sp.]MBR2565158.1 TetR/AcrR family transcriptional regulator [Paenibacillus sp.]
MELKIDRRVKKTKLSLKRAYLELIEQYSEQEITVSMIAQYADLNRATFYAHYSNKEEFLEEALCELLEGLREAVLSPFEDNNRINVNTLAPTTVQIFEYIEYNKRIFYALYNSHSDFEKRLEELFYYIFSKDILIEMKSTMGKINYDMFLHYQSKATLGLIFYWIQGNFQYPAKFMMDQLTIFSNTQVINLKKI